MRETTLHHDASGWRCQGHGQQWGAAPAPPAVTLIPGTVLPAGTAPCPAACPWGHKDSAHFALGGSSPSWFLLNQPHEVREGGTEVF